MLTWNMILTENGAISNEAAYLLHAATCSPFLTRVFSKDEAIVQDLLKNLHQPYQMSEMKNWLSNKKNNDELTLKQHLRQLRALVLARIIVRDLNQLTNYAEVVETISNLAEVAINHAIQFHHQQLVCKYGEPNGVNDKAQQLIVIGMGKLGGRELNVSSDIDLIFAYEEEGKTIGNEVISNQEFFTQLGKKLIATLDEITEHGFVFRVDMGLRPFGSEGALVSNLNALENYYQNHGREWERYAWIKGRVVAGPSAMVNQLLKPFIFRKYLDFNAYAAMRDLKVQIQRDVVKRGLENNIKLGRGGIREIEFIAQLFQLIRGGQDPDFQIKPTLAVLAILEKKEMLSAKVVKELTQSYLFLRNLEHRLMYVDDQQTQDLPSSEETKKCIVRMMNMQDWDGFLQQLNHHRHIVQSHFDNTFQDNRESDTYQAEKAIWQGINTEKEAISHLTGIGYLSPLETLNRLNALQSSHRYLQLPEQSKYRFNNVMPLVIFHAAQTAQPDTTLVRMINLLENICRRASYLALLTEFSDALKLLVKLCAASPWLAQYLSAHPNLLDELLHPTNLYAEPNFDADKIELSQKMQYLAGDVEAQMDAMRHYKHGITLRLAAQDLMMQLSLEKLSDYLSDLAQTILEVSLPTIWQSLSFKHREIPQFAVIGYGKLGGKELGYMSDLDVIFIYDDTHPDAAGIYAKFAQRINNWFNSITNAGLLYEIDLQLRPDGNSGLLVSSIESFEQYQLNKAWVWEHQAISRARFIAGLASIGQAFSEIRSQVITQKRESEQLKKEVSNMREKMREQHAPSLTLFDVKHDAGGIIDVEFIVQYLVLQYAVQYDALTKNIGNIALLLLLGELGLIERAIAEKVANAYRVYRSMIHQTRLQDKQAKMPLSDVIEHRNAVLNLWRKVFVE